MSNAIETQGFKLEIAADPAASPLVYTEIKEIKNFSAFDGQSAEIPVTHLQSVAKEFRMGLQDFGNYQVDINHLSADPGQILARAAKASRVLQQFKATYSDASYDTFTAFVVSAPKSGGVDAVVEGSFALRISGNVTFTPAP